MTQTTRVNAVAVVEISEMLKNVDTMKLNAKVAAEQTQQKGINPQHTIVIIEIYPKSIIIKIRIVNYKKSNALNTLYRETPDDYGFDDDVDERVLYDMEDNIPHSETANATNQTPIHVSRPQRSQPSTTTGIYHPQQNQPSTSTGIYHPQQNQPSTSTGIYHLPQR